MKGPHDTCKVLSGGDLVPYFAHPAFTLYAQNAGVVLPALADECVDCIVTAVPRYTPRGKAAQEAPQIYIDQLVALFDQARHTLKQTGNLWIHLADTYWDGRKARSSAGGAARCGQAPGWLQPKQQMLLPHRFAVAMQDSGWLVRMDVIWTRAGPPSRGARDRCSLVHEHVFHFVKQRTYYFDAQAVAIPSRGKRATKPPPSVWFAEMPSGERPEECEPWMARPLRATCPPGGVVLDPFCRNGAVISAALGLGQERRGIGIESNVPTLARTRARLLKLMNSASGNLSSTKQERVRRHPTKGGQ